MQRAGGSGHYGHGGLDAAELAAYELVSDARLRGGDELPGLIAEHATLLGADRALVYLADLQQTVLLAFTGAAGTATGLHPAPLRVDGTVAGRAYQQVQMLTQPREPPGTGIQVWVPLLNGGERLGVLSLTVPGEVDVSAESAFGVRLRHFADVVCLLVVTKTLHGDSIVRLRREAEMGLAAEMQWALQPPLGYVSREVTVTGGLEPAYEVGGDAIDYAVDAALARAALFDAMGHGLTSGQIAALAVTAYRNSRRAGRTLLDTLAAVDTALAQVFDGSMFATAVLADLDTTTGMLSWINAGHPEPLLLREGRLVKTLHSAPTFPLGVRIVGQSRPPVTVGREALQPGDQVVLYSDGVVEARSPDGDFFGEQRLADLLARSGAACLPAAEHLRRAIRALLDHQAGHLRDDASLLLIDWRSDTVEIFRQT